MQFTPSVLMDENWISIVGTYDKYIDSKYTHTDGKTYCFFGLVHGSDDYYYGMVDSTGKILLCTCCGTLEGHGFTKCLPQSS